MKTFILCTTLMLSLGAIPSVSFVFADVTTYWVGSGGSTTDVGGVAYGNWTSELNWTNGIGINNTMTVVIDDVAENGGNVIMNYNADSFTVNELWIGHDPSPSKMSSLTLLGGILQHTEGANTHKTSRIGDGGPGLLIQTGGIFYMNSGELRIGNNNVAGGTGLYDMSGGRFSTVGGLFPGGNVILNRNKISNAGATTRGELRISGTALVDLGPSNSGVAALAFGPGGGTPGSSVLSVRGPDASINIDSIRMTTVAPSTGTNTNVIEYRFDEKGPSSIYLTGRFVHEGANSTSALLSGGILDVVYTGAVEPSIGATFDLMEGDLILNDGTFFLNPCLAANWKMEVVGTHLSGDATLDVLRLTFLGGQLGPKLVGYWPFEADASTQPDFSGNGSHATPNAGVAWVIDTARMSGVMSFNGNDSFLEVADSKSLSLVGDLTLAAWIKVDNHDGVRSIVAKTEGNQPASYDVYLNANDGTGGFLAGSPGAYAGVNSTSTVPAAEWHHFAVTTTRGEVVFYLDGHPAGIGTNYKALSDSTAPLKIGNRGDLLADFVGRMDDVAIFDGALSQNQIQDIMIGDFTDFGISSRDFTITNIVYDSTEPSAILTFNSRPGRIYAVDSSTDLNVPSQSGGWVEIADRVPSQGTITVFKDQRVAESAQRVFYRIREVN